MLSYIIVLKAIATALVANSHFKGVYPNDIFSFGGGYGLGLFYLISGYLLANIKEDERFGKWYLKRILRIYIPLFIVKTLYVLIGYTQIDSLLDVVNHFLIPGSWFGFSMVIYYAGYYGFVKHIWPRYGKTALITALTICFVCFAGLFICKLPVACFTLESLSIAREFSLETPYLVTQFIWIMLMLLGFVLRKYPDSFLNKAKVLPAVCGLALSLALFLLVKLMTFNGGDVNIQVFLFPSYMLFPYCMMMVARHFDEIMKHFLDTRIGKCVGIISVCSLEIYYMQFVWIDYLKDLAFPLNLMLLFVSIVVSAWIIHVISDFIYGKLRKRLEI